MEESEEQFSTDPKVAQRIAKEVLLTQELLRERLEYDPLTGKFRWKPAKGMGMWRGGLEAGGFTKSGYVLINIEGIPYLAHRLAWFYCYGEWPGDQLDHKNRIRSDNRIDNLRPATNRSNHENRTDNKSGHAGVIWDKARQKWKAYARVDYVMCNIGRYGTIEEAIEARRTFLEKQCS